MKLSDFPYNQEIILVDYAKPYAMISNESIIKLRENNDYSEAKQYLYKSKPHKRTIIIKDSEYYDKLESRHIIIPELMFLATIVKDKNKYFLHKSNLFLIENNELYIANFLNVLDGEICWGEMYCNFQNIKELINAFWNSEFNYSVESTSYLFQKEEMVLLENYKLKKPMV